MKKIILSLFVGFISIFSNAQLDSSWSAQPTLNWSAFADVYYAFSANQPIDNTIFTQGVNYTRHNETALNHAMLKGSLIHPKYRGNVAVQAGLYSLLNYNATINEPSFRNLMEANVGIALNKKSSLWLDAGIFNSHIGFETVISTDNWTLTRSLMAEFSPYYMSGAKLTYQPNSKWEIMGMVANGWQRIVKSSRNTRPNISTLLKYTPSKKITVGWATYAGSDLPNEIRLMRYFSNLYGQFQLTEKFGVTAAFDVGGQQVEKGGDFYALWYTPVMILRYQLSPKWAVAVRGEYFEDKKLVVTDVIDGSEFIMQGSSLNVDFKPNDRVACRIEARALNSKSREFRRRDYFVNDNVFIAAGLAINIR